MYVIKNKKTEMYFKTKITKDMIHCVLDLKEAKQIVSKITANDILKSFKRSDNYEILKINKKGKIQC